MLRKPVTRSASPSTPASTMPRTRSRSSQPACGGRSHSYPPPPGSGPSFKPPVLTQLRMLVEEVNTNSLVVRSGLSSRAAASANGGDPGKRKTTPATDGKKGTVAKGWVSNGGGGPPFHRMG